MTARPPLDPRLLDLLSAYLDGRLSDKEKSTLEDMLEKDAGLRAHMDELRAVREQLRSLPLLHPPRALTLTPAMVGGVNKPHAFPTWPMALGSALAAFAFLFLVSRSLFAGRMLAMNAAPPLFQAPQAAMMENERSAGTQGAVSDMMAVPTAAPATVAPAAAVAETPTQPVLKAHETSATESTPMGTASPKAGYAAGGGPAATEAIPEPKTELGGGGGTPTPAEQNAVMGEVPLEPTFIVGSVDTGPTTPPPATFDWESLVPELEVILALAAILLGVLAVRNAKSRR